MTKARTNVVPFERPAAYWAVRARRHYAPSQWPDAAKMMRKALEKSGDAGLALELAEIYQGMECHTAAERCLLRVTARHGLTGSVCYLVGICALNRGEEELAERAFDLSLRLEPSGVFSQRAQDLLEMYPWRYPAEEEKCHRSAALCRRSFRALDEKERLHWARLAWKRGRAPQTALWLGMLLKEKEALPYLRFACRAMPEDIKPKLLLADAYRQTGNLPKARYCLCQAAALCKTITDTERFCMTAWRVGFPGIALRVVRRHLEQAPGSVDYLRLKYLTLRRLPHQGEAAGRALQALLEIDPEDQAGQYYRRHPEERGIDPNQGLMLSILGGMVFSQPERLRPGMLNRALHWMVMALREQTDTETVYRYLPPLWRRLTRAEKWALDERRDACVPVALALCVLWAAGEKAQALRLYEKALGKKRIRRLTRRLLCAARPPMEGD